MVKNLKDNLRWYRPAKIVKSCYEKYLTSKFNKVTSYANFWTTKDDGIKATCFFADVDKLRSSAKLVSPRLVVQILTSF